ncbi:serine hydrolase [Methylocystis parvus]|uniref:D-alanyl-D-alanine carboxypeptidase n=1 Tax=Methylocystis parvus TaxID=134 RepID=A0A6B8MDT0_9HYPH|nr:serine hydrolase [Methylocystis parvus]QGM98790.1 D-alanyl-D-alanine carboxypeptidase [Methylocystis parvus]WBK00860.1 SPOR domain-containing protein [Methylocystis parvus OBBP]
MLKPSLLDRLAQPRSLAAIFAVIMAFVAITAIPAEARRHGYRHHASHSRHVYHRSFAHHRTLVRHARSHRFYASTSSGGTGGGDGVVGEHHGFAAIVMDANSGKTLYARSEHELRHPASVTKVMTLYLLFEQLDKGHLRLDSPLMISSHAASQAPSKLGLQPGETISVENAIKALVTKSANDIACAVAENIGGDEHSFAQMMTRKAHALGMRNTHYENASGLPDPNQITTAYDLAILGRAIQDRFPRYYRYFSTHSFAYNGALHRNHNHLLGRVEGMDGIKTGYTRASGFNLLTSVRRGNHHIVAVVMGGATAGGRDRIMAQLIEDYIGGGANIRTAAAIAEDASAADEDVVAAAPAPAPIAAPAVERASERQVALNQPVVEQALLSEPVVAPKAADRQPERAAYAPEETTIDPESVGAIPSARALRRAAAPVPPAPIPAREKAEKPVVEKVAEKAQVRPAFVSGVQKRIAEEPAPADKKNAPKALPKNALAAIIDGSTSSRPSKAREITVATTTPSAIRSTSSVAKADAARPTKPGWMIQIGAAEDPSKANELLSRARSQLQGFPSTAKAFTEKVQKGKETLYRARFAGLEEQSAVSACNALKRSGFSCFTTKN